jgi:hypothetical protein
MDESKLKQCLDFELSFASKGIFPPRGALFVTTLAYIILLPIDVKLLV